MADTSGSTPRMRCSIPERFQLHLAMLAMQFAHASFHVVSRAALNMGISKIVFPLYRNIIALILLVPFAYISREERPPLTVSLVVQFFLLAVVGLEQVRLNRKDGIAKVMGTILCVAGASVITLYKGPHNIQPWPTTPTSLAGASGPGRRGGQELDLGLHLPYWELPVVGRVARIAGPGPEEVPGPALVRLVPVFLWGVAISGDSSVL
ncbi:nodulin MtN21 /EamA-like transporter family protein [Actinidia rufa]|uniref:Nodulin MtN21 /EamA-like transporter family protein n=1 Tax=Actinidia rufa TaxID=165716 RepID=A0A7J0E111_9ERIC|nr:nodulin MtN21 /EamA-like transporter family protein [Actinidia rufa]